MDYILALLTPDDKLILSKKLIRTIGLKETVVLQAIINLILPTISSIKEEYIIVLKRLSEESCLQQDELRVILKGLIEDDLISLCGIFNLDECGYISIKINEEKLKSLFI